MEDIQTPVGRMVQGNPLEIITKNMKGAPLVDKQGNPKVEYFFAIAIAKTDPGLSAITQQAQAVALQSFPGGQSQQPNFSWKMVDGDAPENIAKTGFPGHIVFRCTSGFPITCFTKGGKSVITEKEYIKRGYYIRAIISFAGNGDTQRPGIYINCRAVEMYAYGEEIAIGPNGEQLFGQGPTTVPAGASAVPVADVTGGMPGATQVPGGIPGATGVPGGMPGTIEMPTPIGVPGVTAATISPGGMPGAAGVPTGNFLNPQGPPPDTSQGPPAPGNPPNKTMTEKAGGLPYEAYVKQGWTDAQLIAHGYMTTDDIPF